MDKVHELLQLRDSVFKSRSEAFHWDLDNSVEWNNQAVLRSEETDSEGDTGRNHDEETATIGQSTNGEYSYDLNSFVGVMAKNKENDVPFWIGKINKLHKSPEGATTSLTVHWFDVVNDEDIFNGKYYPSYNNNKKQRKATKRTPLIDLVPVDSVLINFRALTKQHRLPAMVSQHLRSLGK